MSKKETNLIARLTKALETVAELLDETVTAGYGAAIELANIDARLGELNERLDAIQKDGIRVTVDFASFQKALAEQTPKPETAKVPELKFPKMLGEEE
jgi:endonuclease IV